MRVQNPDLLVSVKVIAYLYETYLFKDRNADIDLVKASNLFGEMESFLEMYNESHSEGDDRGVADLKKAFEKFNKKKK